MIEVADEALRPLTAPPAQEARAAAPRGFWSALASPVLVPLGFAAIALEGVLVTVARAIPASSQAGARALHFLFAFAQLTGVGVLAAALVLAWRPLRARLRVWPLVPIVGVAIVIALATLPDDVGGIAARLPGNARVDAILIMVGFAFVASLAVVAALPLRRRFGRIPPIVLALALGAVHAFGSPDYPGLHLFAALVAACWMAIGLQPAAPANEPAVDRRQIVFRGAVLAIGLICAASLGVPVPNAVMADMLRSTTSVMAPFARSTKLGSGGKANVPARLRQWFTSRKKLGPVPARTPRVLPDDGVVVLLTIDALRADVVMSGKHDAQLPTLAALRKESVVFPNARTPAPQTVVALTSLFSGKYYSSVFFSEGSAEHPLPTKDKSVRFTDILTKSGVATTTFPTLHDLHPDHGVVGKFDEVVKQKIPPHDINPWAADVADSMIEQLEKVATKSEPAFLYAHFIDPHEPYNRGGTDCEPFDCYLREVAMVDKALARIRATLAAKLGARAVLIVAADHGEAFREHGTRFHATTVYDELLRIPLLVNGPKFEPHVVDAPVSLIDVGPTILDLYGKDTPAVFMGESLLGVLRGEKAAFTRPIAADTGRLMQAMVFEDNVKIMRDKRKEVVELFDLNADPGENESLFETAPDAKKRLAQLSAFFAANAYKKNGYKPPFRK